MNSPQEVRGDNNGAPDHHITISKRLNSSAHRPVLRAIYYCWDTCVYLSAEAFPAPGTAEKISYFPSLLLAYHASCCPAFPSGTGTASKEEGGRKSTDERQTCDNPRRKRGQKKQALAPDNDVPSACGRSLVSLTSSLRRRIMMASSSTIFSSAVLEDPLTSSPNGPWQAAQYLAAQLISFRSI